MEALVCRPILEGDSATQYSYRWAEDPINDLKPHFNVTDLGGREVSKSELLEAVASTKPVVVVHYDHGDQDAWIGNSKEPIMSSQDVSVLSGRIVYTMNCLSASKLGVAAWRAGAKVYVGYVDTFAFTEEENLFRKAAGYGLHLFTSGLTDWHEIRSQMKTKFDEMMGVTHDPWTGMWLRHDRDALRVYNGEEPESGCMFRRLALRIFGKRRGWALLRGRRVD